MPIAWNSVEEEYPEEYEWVWLHVPHGVDADSILTPVPPDPADAKTDFDYNPYVTMGQMTEFDQWVDFKNNHVTGVTHWAWVDVPRFE